MESLGLLTLKEEQEVKDILIQGGFKEHRNSGYGHFAFDDPGEKIYSCGAINVLGMRYPKQGSMRAGTHLEIVYACKDAGLMLPETRIFISGDEMEHMLNLSNSKALTTLKRTDPFAFYDLENHSLDPKMLNRIQNYKPKNTP